MNRWGQGAGLRGEPAEQDCRQEHRRVRQPSVAEGCQLLGELLSGRERPGKSLPPSPADQEVE